MGIATYRSKWTEQPRHGESTCLTRADGYRAVDVSDHELVRDTIVRPISPNWAVDCVDAARNAGSEVCSRTFFMSTSSAIADRSRWGGASHATMGRARRDPLWDAPHAVGGSRLRGPKC